MNRPRLLGLLLAAGCYAAPALAQQPAPTTPAPAAPATATPAASAPATLEVTEDPDDSQSKAFWEDYELDLDFHPLGYGLSRNKRYTFDNYTPMHPSGFRADKFSMYPNPTYAFGKGWQASVGVTGAERIGPGGNALFYGAGVQKQFMKETRTQPALSLGIYGLVGPHSHNSQTLYLAASKRVAGGTGRKYAVFVTAGGKFERYDGDDYGDGTGLRPFVGATLALKKRVFLSAEVSPAQPWEDATMYSVRGSYRVYKSYAITGGIRSNGYRTLPFIGIGF
jgi:hypothetical protein